MLGDSGFSGRHQANQMHSIALDSVSGNACLHASRRANGVYGLVMLPDTQGPECFGSGSKRLRSINNSERQMVYSICRFRLDA